MTHLSWDDFPEVPRRGWPGRRRAQVRLVLEVVVMALGLLAAFYAIAVYGAALA